MQTIELDNPNQLAGVLAGVGAQLSRVRYKPVLDRSMRMFEEEHGVTFAGQHEPASGNAWAPLSKRTRKKVGIHGPTRILVDTGEMRASVVSPNSKYGIRQIFDDMPDHAGMLFGTEAPYAMFHETGTKRMPARPFVGLSESTVDRMCGFIADHAVQELAK